MSRKKEKERISIVMEGGKIEVEARITFPWWYSVVTMVVVTMALAAMGRFPEAIEVIGYLLAIISSLS